MAGVRALTKEEIQKCAGLFEGRYRFRNRALFLTQYYLGARITETLSLTRGDLVAPDGSIVREVFFKRRNVKMKTAGESVPLMDEAREALRPWLSQLEEMGYAAADAPVFVSVRGQILTRHAAFEIYGKVFRKAALAGRLGTHSLRKAAGQRVYEGSGHDVRLVQAFLRQRSLDSTEHYLGVKKGAINEAMKKFL